MQQQVWQCKRCGSSERRTQREGQSRSSRSTGCAECHRRRARAYRQQRARLQHPGLTHLEALLFHRLLRDDFDDVPVTGAAREYLRAFDAYVAAVKAGDSRAARDAERARHAALIRLED